MKRKRQFSILLKGNGIVFFDSKKNANFADSSLQKLICPKNKFLIKTIKEYCKQIRVGGHFLHNIKVTLVEKILNYLDVTKVSRIDQT